MIFGMSYLIITIVVHCLMKTTYVLLREDLKYKEEVTELDVKAVLYLQILSESVIVAYDALMIYFCVEMVLFLVTRLIPLRAKKLI